MILAILFAWLGYKKANANGRNGILWAIIAAGVFIATQFIVSLLLGILLGVFLAAKGGTEKDFDDYSIPITIVAIIASIGAGMLALHFADKTPSTEENHLPPPSPPRFD